MLRYDHTSPTSPGIALQPTWKEGAYVVSTLLLGAALHLALGPWRECLRRKHSTELTP